MKRRRTFGTPFRAAVLGCLVLAGWALWTGGILDGPMARDLRASSVYAAPGVEVDIAAAERIVGNRRLVVAFLEPGADLRQGCKDIDGAAEGTVGLLLSRDGEDYTRYGCSYLPGGDDENFGKAVVAESRIASGVDQFVDDPLGALKVIAVNYDLLVKAGIVPDGARTISPSLPRYLIAGTAVLAVLTGAVLAYAAARRAGRLAAEHRAERDLAGDARSSLSTRAAFLAQRIIELDRRYSRSREERFRREYRELATEYAELVAVFADADDRGAVDPGLRERVDQLTARCTALAKTRS